MGGAGNFRGSQDTGGVAASGLLSILDIPTSLCHYPSYGMNGNVIACLASSGKPVARFEYETFGNQRPKLHIKMRIIRKFFPVFALVLCAVGLAFDAIAEAPPESDGIRHGGPLSRDQAGDMAADLHCSLEIRSIDGSNKVGHILLRDENIRFEDAQRWRVVAVVASRFDYEEIQFARPVKGFDDASLSELRDEWENKWIFELGIYELPTDTKVVFLIEYDKATGEIPNLGTFLTYEPTGRGAAFQKIALGSYLVVAMNAERVVKVREVNNSSKTDHKWSDLISSGTDVKRVSALIESRKRCSKCQSRHGS